MKLDISKFKRIGEATLKHPQGHKIILNKGSLDKNHLKQLSAIPMASGGEADDEEDLLSGASSPDISENRSETGLSSRPAREDEIRQQKLKDSYNEFGVVEPERQVLQMDSNDPIVLESQAKILKHDREQDEAPANYAKEKAQSDWEDQARAIDAYNAEAKKSGLALKQMPPPPAEEPPMSQSPQSMQPEMVGQTDIAPSAPQAMPGGVDNSGMNDQMRANNMAAQAQAQAGNQSAEVLGQAVQEKQNDLNEFQQNTQKFQQDHEHFMNDLNNQHIDPDHFLKSMGTGGKIMTAIGLLLGGFAPATGENSGLKMLKEDIDRDIDSQKMDMAKADKLLQANMQYYGNIRQAADMTRIMKYEMVGYKLNQIAQQSQDPMAKARALAANGVIKQQVASDLSKMGLQQTLLNRMTAANAPSGGGLSTAQQVLLLKRSGQIGEKEAAEAMKEVSKSEEVNQSMQNTLNSFDEIHKQFLNGVLSPKDVESAQQAFIGKVIRDSEGRFNYEAAQNLAKAIFPSKWETDATSMKKRARIPELFKSMISTPYLDSMKLYGINPKTNGAFDMQGKSKFKESAPKF